jgi:D-3-phosphoglycerate dehydrogenase
MSAEVTSGAHDKFVASGTLFGNEMPRLIRLGDFRLEAYLDGNLLIFTHHDVPGIIGAVGTIFGKHKVNIAQMSVGRASAVPGGEAIGVLNLDSVPPPAAQQEMAAHKDVQSVKVIELPPAEKLPPWLSS